MLIVTGTDAPVGGVVPGMALIEGVMVDGVWFDKARGCVGELAERYAK